jgi:hypothetical protein
MNTATKNYQLGHLKMTEGFFYKSDEWLEAIEEDGGFAAKNQYIIFNSNGIEVIVDFDISVTGNVSHSVGDWYTPSHTDVDIMDIDIDIISLHVDDWEVELNPEIEDFLKIEIKKNL